MPSLSLNPFKTLENLLDRDGRHLGRKGEVFLPESGTERLMVIRTDR